MNNSAQTANQTDADEMIGNMSREEFEQINEQAAAEVEQIEPTEDSLAATDQSLILEIAKGGMMQLEVSQIAVDNATDEEVQLLAQAEVEEQTGLSEKLQEIADAKGVTLPSGVDAETQRIINQLESLSGDEFDRAYVEKSGVQGYEKLNDVMSRVQSQADDENLVEIATVALPLIKTHLQVSQDILNKFD